MATFHNLSAPSGSAAGKEMAVNGGDYLAGVHQRHNMRVFQQVPDPCVTGFEYVDELFVGFLQAAPDIGQYVFQPVGDLFHRPERENICRAFQGVGVPEDAVDHLHVYRPITGKQFQVVGYPGQPDSGFLGKQIKGFVVDIFHGFITVAWY
jgi:hypothetical protein